jgi:D-glycero-D-manno-heptose 1,7-bisphosphate phosphatase
VSKASTIPENLPFGAEIDADGLWSQVLNRAQGAGRRAALFLDRDGVVIEEVHYLHKPADVRLIEGAAGLIGEANKSGVPVILVSNQAGIARGFYGWEEFIAVQDKVLDDLAQEDVFLNGVFVCPHHGDGKPPYDTAEHPWRKPNPGMLIAAAQRLPVDLGASWIVGDQASDLEAGKNARLAGGVHVLSGHGKDDGERDGALALSGNGFQVLGAKDLKGAVSLLPLL